MILLKYLVLRIPLVDLVSAIGCSEWPGGLLFYWVKIGLTPWWARSWAATMAFVGMFDSTSCCVDFSGS